MEKASFTSLPSGGDHDHGGKAANSSSGRYYRPICMHEPCIATRMAVGQSRNNAVAMAGGNVEVQRGVRGGPRGGDGAAGVIRNPQYLQEERVKRGDVTPETESDGACDGGMNLEVLFPVVAVIAWNRRKLKRSCVSVFIRLRIF